MEDNEMLYCNVCKVKIYSLQHYLWSSHKNKLITFLNSLPSDQELEDKLSDDLSRLKSAIEIFEQLKPEIIDKIKNLE